MERRYVALRIIGTVYKVLGGIVAALTILGVLAVCLTSIFGGAALGSLGRELGGDTALAGLFGGVVGGVIASVAIVLYGGGVAAALYAIGEGIYLLLALEENTRATTALLQRQLFRPAPAPPIQPAGDAEDA